MKKDKIYFLAGIFFLLLEIMVFIRNSGNYINFFWVCNFVPVLFAIAFFAKKVHVVKALINVVLIPDVFFLIDFFTSIFFHHGFLCPMQSYFQEGLLFIIVSVLLHVVAFIALLFTYEIKPKIKTLIFSVCFIIIIYFITLIFSPSNLYYNYVHNSKPGCISIGIPYKFITISWPIIMFAGVILLGQAIQYLIYRFHVRKRNKK